MADNLETKNGVPGSNPSPSRGTLWLRGMPAAGKSTLAKILHEKMRELGELIFEYIRFPSK